MKKISKILLILIITILAAGCSVVFTSSITGSLVDSEIYDNGDTGYGISDAEIYLYTDIDERDDDYNAWIADNSILPDNPIEGDPEYFLKTITDEQGNYTFNGFIWNELFPDYGKSGDRKEVFMLFYHNDYGLNKTTYPVYVVSDVTNRIPLYKLNKIMNTAEIAGSIIDADTQDPLPNANVRIWVPQSWSYDTNGNISTNEADFSWNDSPSYTALTDAQGEWQQTISYKMMPSSTANNETTLVRLTFSANGYIAENAADSRITDGGWDRDANGSVDTDEEDAYFQSGEITDGSYAELGEIALADEYNTAVVSGRVVNSNTNSGEQGVSVRIWVADDWSYTSEDPDSIAAPASANVEWLENPSYTVTTDAEGNYSSNIEFERKPSESDNKKTTRVRIVFIKDSFLINNSTDEKLIDNPAPGGSWDRDGSGIVDADEDDAFYDPADVITAELDNDIGTIVVKQTEFSETLSGEVWNNGQTELVNGAEVWLFYAPEDHDADSSTPLETDPAPAAGAVPDYVDTSASIMVTADSIEKGHFAFNSLEWTDTAYTTSQSKVSYYIYMPATAAERSNGYLSGDLTSSNKYYLTAGSTNYVSLEQAP